MFHSIDEYKEPYSLISTDEHGKFILNYDAVKRIHDICLNKHLHIICITGPYRTGKSYLMNRLAGVKTGILTGFHNINKS